MTTIDETTLTGDVRAAVSFARDNGLHVDKGVNVPLAIADLLELPDDTMFVPATCAAMATPTQLTDPASMARTRHIALAAGYGQPLSVLPGLA
jgi:hypothetical protein